jgi:hypothetical protein
MEHAALIENIRKTNKIVVGKPERKRSWNS